MAFTSGITGPLIGGLNRSPLAGGAPLPDALRSRWFSFSQPDQDALNAAIEVWDGPVSYFGKDGMGFIYGLSVLPHAVGRAKPWKVKYLRRSLSGHTPRTVDKAYWKSVSYPIKVYSYRYISWKKTIVNFAAFLGRFYARI